MPKGFSRRGLFQAAPLGAAAAFLSPQHAAAQEQPTAIPSLKFEPAIHVNYGETVLRIKDGLPKLKDFPAEMGGSGEMLAE